MSRMQFHAASMPALVLSTLLSAGLALGADTDADGVDDAVDNCTVVANADQRDTNADGFGNLCDPDLNNDGVVNFIDVGLLRAEFFTTSSGDADFTGDGQVNFLDLGVLRAYLFSQPGPGVGDLLSAPSLDPAGGTTAANPFPLSGVSVPGGEIRLLVNGAHQATATVEPDGSFAINAPLFDGINSIQAVLALGQYTSPHSNTVTLYYLNQLPVVQGGDIDMPTVWTARDGLAYEIVDDLHIGEAGSLLLQAGAVLRFADGVTLHAQGVLDIRGTSVAPVLLTALSQAPTEGSWGGLRISADGSVVQNARLEYAQQGIAVDGADVVLRYNVVRYSSTYGIFMHSGAGGVVLGNSVGEGVLSAYSLNLNNVADSLFIFNNEFYGNRFGVYCTNASPIIAGNMIHDTARGITVFRESAPWIVDGNSMFDNERGLHLLGTGDIGGNPEPLVNGNSFLNNSEASVYAEGFFDASNVKVDFTGNWWGSIALGDITAAIHDFTEEADGAVIDFSGFLAAPGGQPVIANLVLGGRLSPEQPWYTAEPNEVVGRVVVASGDSVTIPAGAHLNFYDSAAGLEVHGTLKVQGTPGKPVLLTSGLPQPGGRAWAGVTIKPGASNVAVSNAHISFAYQGLVIDGNAGSNLVASSTISDFGLRAIRLQNGSQADIVGNTVNAPRPVSGTVTGITFIDSGGLVEGNNVQQVDIGIGLTNSSPTISGNSISNNAVGISIFRQSSPLISLNNVIRGNQRGIEVSGTASAGNNPQPVTSGNAIFSNGVNYFATSTFFDAASVVLDATANWWGSDDALKIANGIFDSADSPDGFTPTVDFADFLCAPVRGQGCR